MDITLVQISNAARKIFLKVLPILVLPGFECRIIRVEGSLQKEAIPEALHMFFTATTRGITGIVSHSVIIL